MDESSAPPKRRALNHKQRRFIAEYFIDFNASGAAIRAGYSQNNTSVGWDLLHNPAIMAAIQRRCVDSLARLEITGDDIRQGFAQIAFDPRDSLGGGPTRMERLIALRELGRLHGLYIEKHVFTGATLEQLLAAAADQEKQLPPATPPLRLISGGKS